MQNEDEAWIEWREKFSELYDESNYSSPLQSHLMRASHKLVEKRFDARDHFTKVIEIGAGTGEHLTFVRHRFDEYILTDCDSQTIEVAERKLAASCSRHVTFSVQTGSELSYPDNTFDRLVATHVLEHIYQPHLALKEWRRVLKNGGVISILIPTDPGVAWRLGRQFGPRRNAIKRGINYDYVMAREHVNSANNLIALLRHYFPTSTENWWPLRTPSIDLNLFFAFNAIIEKGGEG